MEDFFKLMKMSQYKSGTVFTVAICLASLLLGILIAYACDLAALKAARDRAAEDYHDAQQALIDHEAKQPGYLIASAVIGSGAGAAGSGVTAMLGGAAFSPPAVAGAGTTAVVGVSSWWLYELVNLQSDVNNKSATYAAARADYEACANPPAKYTFTEPSSGYVWEFCATMYGSDSEAYTAYMEFLEKRGYQ